MKLTDEQFRAIDDKVTALLRASKRGTPERERADAIAKEWEAAWHMPAVRAVDREVRYEAIAAVALKHGLVGGDA